MSDSRGPAPEEHAPAVSWFELFYDLIVVASVSVTNDVYLEHPSLGTAWLAVWGMTAMCWVWFLTTVLNNAYPSDGLVRRILTLAQMAALVVAALAVNQGESISNDKGMVAYGIALAIVGSMILRASRGARGMPLGRQGLPILVAAGIAIVAGLFGLVPLWPYVIIALVVSVIPFVTMRTNQGRPTYVLRPDHLRERLGLFILIILGDGFAQLVAVLSATGSIPNIGVFAMTFLISFSLWWIYFDGTFTRRVGLGHVRWRMSLLAHLALVFGMIGTLDCLVLFTVREQDRFGDQHLAYFGVCFGIVLVAFAVLGFTVRGRWGAVSWAQGLSGAGVLAIGLIALPGADIPIYSVMVAAGVIIVANAAFAAWLDRRPVPASAE